MSVADPIAARRFYIAATTALGFLFFIQQLNEQWSRDVFVHLAVIDEFSQNGLSPDNPFTGTSTPDAYLTSFHLAAGAMQSVFLLDSTTTLVAMAMMNWVFIALGIWRLGRAVSTWASAPVVLLASTLLLWGWDPWRWSGYPNLNSLGFGLPYP